LYVDVVKNMPKPESSPPVTPPPLPPPRFTILHEDFPALPGTPEAHVPDDWTAMISDDDADAVVQQDKQLELQLQLELEPQQQEQQQQQQQEQKATTPDSVMKELTHHQPSFYLCLGNSIFDKQFLADGVGQRAWSRQKSSEVTTTTNGNGNGNANSSIGPPPGFEHIKFFGRLRTNRMGVPLGGVTFDSAPPQRDSRNRWNRSPQSGRGIEGAYGLAGLAGNLEAAQQNPKLLSQIFGHDVDTHYCACEANKLYATFAGPLQGGRCTPHEVHHDVPLHYRRAGARDLPQPKTDQMEVELLFFFFYTYPGDMMQMLAAAELAERGWRFHIFERLWLRRQSDNPHYKRCGYQESGEYNYFNMVHWRILARHFDLMPQQLERTITKSELREQYGYHPQMRWV
ncbi:hypothetical protein KR222_000977, partial [Zaprionus bogoriensis]